MIEPIQKKIFLDYDECMGHTLCASNEDHADQLIDMYGEHWRGEKFVLVADGWDIQQEWYVTFKRSWTDDLIRFSKHLVGDVNVYILTSSVGDYIRKCNFSLELGFDPNTHIFSREDLFTYDKHPDFTNTHNVLVDNLSYNDNSTGITSKISFLSNIPPTQYVKVYDFTVWREKPKRDDEYFNDLKDRITSALEIQ